MDMIKAQELVDSFIPEIRKELLSDVKSALSQTKDVSKLSADDLSCLMEAAADAGLKASAKLLVETLAKIP